MVKRIGARHWAEITLIIVNLVAFHKWFLNFSTLTWGDWTPRFSVTSRGLFVPPYMWTVNTLGSVDAAPSFYPFYAMEGLLSRLGFSYPFMERVIYMWPLIIAGALGSYYLVRKIAGSGLPAFAGSIAYTFNTYSSTLKTGHLTVLAAIAFAPVVILFFIKALEEKRYYLAVVCGLFSWVASFYESRMFYVIACVLLLYFLYHTFFIERPAWRVFGKNVVLAAIPFVIVFLTNLYWILGIYEGGGLPANQAFTGTLFGSRYINLLNAVALSHPFWTFSKFESFVVHPVPGYLYFVPIAAFAGLLLGRRNRKVVFFGAIAVIGILLTKQAAEPFSHLYAWLFHHVPGLSLFREASKFYFLIVLGYSVLIAAFVAGLLRGLPRVKWRRWARYVLIALVILLFLVNAWPFITGSSGSLFVSRRPPEEYVAFKDFALSRKGFERTLWLPTASRWSVYTWDKPLVDGLEVTNTSWSPFIETIPHKLDWRDSEQITWIYRKDYAPELLADASVMYVAVPTRDTVNDDDFYFRFGGGRYYFIDALNKLEFLERIDAGTHDLAVYRFKQFRPYVEGLDHVFGLNDLKGLEEKYRLVTGLSGLRFSFALPGTGSTRVLTPVSADPAISLAPPASVTFTNVNPTRKRIHVKGATTAFFLSMAESYHPGWKLMLDNEKVKGPLKSWLPMAKPDLVEEKYHYKLDDVTNAWYVDTPELAEDGLIEPNPDGTCDMELVAEFWPQRYCYAGFVVSVMTLLGCLGYLLVVGVIAWRKRRGDRGAGFQPEDGHRPPGPVNVQ